MFLPAAYGTKSESWKHSLNRTVFRESKPQWDFKSCICAHLPLLFYPKCERERERKRERERERIFQKCQMTFFDQLKKINFSLLKISRRINNCWCINNLWITSDWKRRICRELISENRKSWRKICFNQFQVTYACALTYYILHIIITYWI